MTAGAPEVRVVVLVEGESDRVAIEALARRRGRDLASEGVDVVAIGGAQAASAHRARLRAGVAVRGVCDAGEADVFRQAFDDPDDVVVCDQDLEDELIRALGVPRVIRIVEEEGELDSFRLLQRQPAHRGTPVARQLHRFLASKGGRKIRYARLLAEALDTDRVPAPLARLLARV